VKKMRSVTAALLFLGVVAYTQARLLRVAEDMNITGNGALCVDDKGMPIRFLDNTKTLVENCGSLRLGGSIRSHNIAVRNVKIGVHFARECSPITLASSIDPLTTFEVPFLSENKKFEAPVGIAALLSGALLTYQDCSIGPQVCLMMSVFREAQSTTEAQFETFFSQDFVLKICREQAMQARVHVDCGFRPPGGDGRIEVTVHNGDGGNDPRPFIQMTDIMDNLKAVISDADLPENAQTNPAQPKWPRGILVYMTRREVDPCNPKSANMRADDEMLAFYPMNQGMDKLSNHNVDYGREVRFGVVGKCLFCGEVTVVVMYDFLGSGKPRPADCGDIRVARVHMKCDGIVEYTKAEIIPYFKDPSSMWIRTCYGHHGIKLQKFDQAMDKTRLQNVKQEGNDFEMNGVARLYVVASIYQEDVGFCAAFEDKAVEELAVVAAKMSDECRMFLGAEMKTNYFMNIDFKANLKTKCDYDPVLFSLFDKFDKSRSETDESAKKGFCPDVGLRTDDAFNDEFTDRLSPDKGRFLAAKMEMRTSMNPLAICDDVLPATECGYRALAAIMNSAQRFMANNDLYDDHMAKDFNTDFEAAKPLLSAYYGQDTEHLRNCPRPDFFKPLDTTPAVWRLSEWGPMRGYYSLIQQKWCYHKVATWKCPACVTTIKAKKALLCAANPADPQCYCDPAKDPYCAIAVCDPAKDPNCALIPACDPATDPNCVVIPVCDPAKDPNCPTT
jgi:hypothetical protein